MPNSRTISAKNLNRIRVAQAIISIAKYARLSLLFITSLPATYLLMCEPPTSEHWGTDFLLSKVSGFIIFGVIYFLSKKWNKENLLPKL